MKIDKVTILVKKVSLEFSKLSNPIFLKYELTEAQYKILKYLYSHQNTVVRQVDLEKYFSLTHPTAIGLLENLEKKEFIRRRENPEDKRSRIILLEKRALEMQDELERLGDMLEEKMTENLTGEERSQLVFLLQKLLGIKR